MPVQLHAFDQGTVFEVFGGIARSLSGTLLPFLF